MTVQFAVFTRLQVLIDRHRRHHMDVSDYITFVAEEGDLFASAAGHGDMNVAIAPCPSWHMRELVRHLGMIHLWAAANIAFPEPDWLAVKELPDLTKYWPGLAAGYPEDVDLVAWYRDTLANLIDVFEAAPADLTAFTFLPAPSPLSMWSRRQASEIAIHRFDAEQARGITSHFDPQFASDMLDELLTGFAVRPGAIDVDSDRTVHINAQDVDEHWFLTIGPAGMRTGRHAGDADLTVVGTASELYLLFWNRTPDTTVGLSGDTSLMDLWRSTCRVRWS